MSTTNAFIRDHFQRLECTQYVQSDRKSKSVGCVCGLNICAHKQEVTDEGVDKKSESSTPPRWQLANHTKFEPTNAYGTIEFQGGPHLHKAQYARIGFHTDPALIMQLFLNQWQIKTPKLVITVNGGFDNFPIGPKLQRAFRHGLLKAAKTTGAWIITTGLNKGAAKHAAGAVAEGGHYRATKKNQIVTIGVAPWGMLKKRHSFITNGGSVAYHPKAFSSKGNLAVLNDKHSYFLLVDNGTVGRLGADIVLRGHLERFISRMPIDGYMNKKGSFKTVPVVSVILGGGACTIRTVLKYVQNKPPIAVVVCDGSGRAADILACARHNSHIEGFLKFGLPKLVSKKLELGADSSELDSIVSDVRQCIDNPLMTVFRTGDEQDVDHAILSALLKGQQISAPDQLSLALTWNRVDIASRDIFIFGVEWPAGSLDAIMMDALLHDRVDFVKLLLKNGVSMRRFLTVQRLEELYNHQSESGRNTLKWILQDVKPDYKSRDWINLPLIGLCIRQLMGGAYYSSYSSPHFKQKYDKIVAKTLSDINKKGVEEKNKKEEEKRKKGETKTDDTGGSKSKKPSAKENHEDKESGKDEDVHFTYPFNELLLWAVLTNRQPMAHCMWLHGEEALAKALVAMKLYKSLSREAADDYLEQEICSTLKENSDVFRQCSLELLEACYKCEDEVTMQLLTYELANWGKQTCLTLAVLAHHKEFLAHPCCQILLADLWNGGLRMRKYGNWKILLGLICPFYILFLDFKTKEELQLQPQTAAEHADAEGGSFVGSQLYFDEDADEDKSVDVETGTHAEHTVNQLTDAAIDAKQLKSNKIVDAKQLSSTRKLETVIDSPFHGPTTRKAAGVSPTSTNTPLYCSLLRWFAKKLNSTLSKCNHWDTASTSSMLTDSDEDMLRYAEHCKRMPAGGDVKSSVKFGSPPDQSKIGAARNPLQQVGFKDNGVRSPTHHDSAAVNPKSRRNTNNNIGCKTKYYEFYVAPVTTFWSFTLSYAVFLCCFTYITLVKTPPVPSAPEIFVVLYVFALWCDNIRKILMAEPIEFRNKVKVFCTRTWNWMTLLSCLFFFLGVAMRLSNDAEIRKAGRLVYCIDIVYWYVKLLDIMSVNSHLGPYITMVGKMVANMSYICCILTVVMMAFGVTRQSILFPNQEWRWMLVRNIFYKPYFMLYGEVYAPEIDECGDFGKNCVFGGWLTPLFMCVFLLVSNILCINLLIAVFNNIFTETNAVSQQIWKFQRYTQVMEYQSAPILPPPFSLFTHSFLLYKYLGKETFGRKKKLTFDYALKLFLKPDEVERINDIEEEVMEEMMRKKDEEGANSMKERVRKIHETVEIVAMRVDELKHDAHRPSWLREVRHVPPPPSTATGKDKDTKMQPKDERQMSEKLDDVLRMVEQLAKGQPKHIHDYLSPPHDVQQYSYGSDASLDAYFATGSAMGAGTSSDLGFGTNRRPAGASTEYRDYSDNFEEVIFDCDSADDM